MGEILLDNSVFIISMIATFLLIIPANIKVIIIGLLLLVGYILYFYKKKLQVNVKINNENIFLSLLICLFVGLRFFYIWMHSSKIMYICEMIHINLYLFLGIITIIGIIFAIPFMIVVLNKLYKLYSKITFTTDRDINQKITLKQRCFIAIIAIIVITLFSKSSFLYPLNDWVDSNCFMTVGKSILHGKVPYLDLYEQKGPLLYFIHAFAAMISSTTFIGVYFIEVIACYFFLYYSYRILIMYTDKNIIFLLPVLSLLVYSSTNFCHGDSAEELCLPLLSYALYIGIKFLKKRTVPPAYESLMIGITSSCVLWIKYSMLGFYIGWIIIPAVVLIKNKQLKELLKMILFIILGVIIVSIPIIIYFLYNDALIEMFKVYFYNNIFLYNSDQSIPVISTLYNVFKAVTSWISNNSLISFLIIIGVIIIKKDHLIFKFILVLIIFTALFIFRNSLSYTYYSFILSIFTLFGLIPLYRFINKNNVMKILLLYLITIVISINQSSNTYLIFENKENLPQYKFKEIICKEDNPTLLNYGFLDGGFYTVCDIVPTCKYFCKLNIQLDEMYEGQNQCLEKGLVDFVVTRNEEIKYEHYELVSTSSYYFEGQIFYYYLYQLK